MMTDLARSGPIAGLIFDKDGTLFDFNATWGGWTRRILTELAQATGVDAAELGARVGYDFDAGFAADSPIIAGTLAQIVDLLVLGLPEGTALSGKPALAAFLETRAEVAEVVEVVPLAEFLNQLQLAGYRIGVMTNDTERSARAHLAAVSVVGMDVIIGADSGHGAKPDAAPLLAVARLIDVRPDRVAMVGDSRHDLAAGRAAGMVTVGVLTGPAKAADLADLADVVLSSIAELPAWLSARVC
jgi:phosphoglycolate phosphatase